MPAIEASVIHPRYFHCRSITSVRRPRYRMYISIRTRFTHTFSMYKEVRLFTRTPPPRGQRARAYRHSFMPAGCSGNDAANHETPGASSPPTTRRSAARQGSLITDHSCQRGLPNTKYEPGHEGQHPHMRASVQWDTKVPRPLSVNTDKKSGRPKFNVGNARSIACFSLGSLNNLVLRPQKFGQQHKQCIYAHMQPTFHFLEKVECTTKMIMRVHAPSLRVMLSAHP